MLDGGDLVGRDAEEEEVVDSDPVENLDVGAVERADGDRTIEGQFHIASAGRLLTGERDLFRDIAGGHD